MTLQTARQLGIRSLYRYQPFHGEWLVAMLSESRIHLSDPARFNDPWDCKPNFTLDEDGQKKALAWMDQILRRESASDEDREKEIAMYRNEPERLVKFLEDSQFVLQNEIDASYKLCCLSTEPDHVLMWSHYATQHTGICLEFSADNDVFGQAYKVTYSRKYPRIEFGGQDQMHLVLTCKSFNWEYEHEFRLIAAERGGDSHPAMLKTDGNFLQIPRGALN